MTASQLRKTINALASGGVQFVVNLDATGKQTGLHSIGCFTNPDLSAEFYVPPTADQERLIPLVSYMSSHPEKFPELSEHSQCEIEIGNTVVLVSRIPSPDDVSSPNYPTAAVRAATEFYGKRVPLLQVSGYFSN